MGLNKTYCDAINEAMCEEMARDPRVILYGLDVTDHKAIFGSTKNIAQKFGPERCFGTPLSEDTMMGFGLGAAINGLRPIHVHIRVDFLLLAMNQLVNMVSCYRYMSGGKLNVPLVIRAVIGRGWGQSFQHSKSLQSFFAHIPGLKVVMPSTPRDAKGLLISAIRDENPVVFLEHRWLYFIEGDVPEEEVIPLGKARVLREGSDYTIVATSWMNVEAMKAAEILKKQNIFVEVIDPRTLYPLDEESICNSVVKTGHCLVVDYDWVNCGFSSEVAARVSEKCFGKLKTPVRRLGFAHSPCPSVRKLEDKFYPNAKDIIRTIEKDLDLPELDLSQEEFYTYENLFKGPF